MQALKKWQFLLSYSNQTLIFSAYYSATNSLYSCPEQDNLTDMIGICCLMKQGKDKWDLSCCKIFFIVVDYSPHCTFHPCDSFILQLGVYTS